MRVVCSWCEAEGKPAIVREKEPLEDPEETHGVCPEHKERLSDPQPKAVSRSDERGSAKFLDQSVPKAFVAMLVGNDRLP